MTDHKWDDNRERRTGIAEVILCSGKSSGQISEILLSHLGEPFAVLLTRLTPHAFSQLDKNIANKIEYFEQANLAYFQSEHIQPLGDNQKLVAIVTAGTSDTPVALEAQKTLAFNGVDAPIITDVGVAGVHRLLSRVEYLNEFKILIAVAGMEGALFSVLGGLVKAPVIAVPSSVGYGVSEGGQAALSSALASCAPGVLVVNINNGFGAAAAAIKMLHVFRAK